MQLAPMRYTKIDGTAVAVSVKSAAEAKAAVKELRHKKRELKFLRAALVRRLRAVQPKQERRRGRAERSVLGHTLIGLGSLVAGLITYAVWDAGPGIALAVLFATVIVYFVRRSRGGGLADPGRPPLDR